MKSSVDRMLNDVQGLSKRMRNRVDMVDELLQMTGTVQSKLDAMRLFQDESLQFNELAKQADKNPRKHQILCLFAENKQLEQLKMQNKTLETSLEEHELTLEMIMSKYREQISSLMATNKTNESVHTSQPREEQQPAVNGQQDSHENANLGSINSTGDPERSRLGDERLAVMAAIAKEVAEQSESYSNELETELHRLQTENQALRELLSVDSIMHLREGDKTPPPGPLVEETNVFLNSSRDSDDGGSTIESDGTYDCDTGDTAVDPTTKAAY